MLLIGNVYATQSLVGFRRVDDAMPQHDATGPLVTVAAAVDSQPSP
jgi:hypothetical protein